MIAEENRAAMTTSLPYFNRKASSRSFIGTHQSEISYFDGESPAVRIPPTGVLNANEESLIVDRESCFYSYTHTDGYRHKAPYPQSLTVNLVNLLKVLAKGKSSCRALESRLLTVNQVAKILFRESLHVEDLIARQTIDTIYVDDNRCIDSEQLFRFFCERDRKRISVINNMILIEKDYVEA